MFVIAIDPDHDGSKKVGGSSAHNATSASNVIEKDITLDIARRLRFSLQQGSGQRRAEQLY